jgi:hypothetical protein
MALLCVKVGAIFALLKRIVTEGSANGSAGAVVSQVNIRGYLGATALCRASRRGQLDAIEALLTAPGARKAGV